MPAAGRVIEVASDRLAGWVDRFADRHGPVSVSVTEDSPATVVVTASDGARAAIAVPYGPLPAGPAGADAIARLVEHLRVPRAVGLLLVRRSGWAVGVVAAGRLVAAEAGGGHVQGNTKAGGWSQQRYARRRGHQAQQVWQRAADGTAGVLASRIDELDAVVTGGDRAGVAAVLADPRLAGLRPLVEPRFLDVGEPKRSLLPGVAERLQAVVITLNELA